MSAVLSYVTESAFRLSSRLLGWAPPRWFRLWMITATRLGDGWLWVAAALALGAGGGACHRALGAAALPLRHPSVRPLPVGPLLLPVRPRLDAFTIGTVLALSFPTLAPGMVLVAGRVAASRLVLGLHFLSDVLAGMVLGTLIGSSVFTLLVR